MDTKFQQATVPQDPGLGVHLDVEVSNSPKTKDSLLVLVHLLGLLGPLVALDTTGEELNGDVDLFFDLCRHLADLFKGKDAQSVQLLFDERPDALDGLQVVFL